jgi:murein DD-endopeptidase MepM/ murein hydrolase activator NlpD
VTQNSGRIWHDYKRATVQESKRRPSVRWPWFAAGVVLPLVGVLFIGGRPDAAAPEDALAADDDASLYAALVPLIMAQAEAGNDARPAESAVAEAITASDAADTAPLAAGTVPLLPPASRTAVPLSDALGQPLRAAAVPLMLAPPPEAGEVLAALERETAQQGPAPGEAAIVELRVARGDTLERMFRRNSLSIGDMMAVLADEQSRRHLSILRPGDVILVQHEEGRVARITREIDEIRILEVLRADSGFVSSISERPVETRVVTATAVINSSLFNAGRAAGVPDSVTMSVAGLFQWDVDFALDIRQGDRYTVVYQELWRDGERLRIGSILAAEFVNRGRIHRVVRFEMDDKPDYFTPEGRSVRKAFIRAPVDFTRISSRFNLNRRHPVLHTIRAHRGVDYAAPTGTPIKAAGDGRVIFRGVQGGYGNTVILQHGSNITTLYAHLSRFHPQVRQGTRVRQGQLIGYVGMTGLATGPHLHYEYRVNGVHRDPLTVELPPAEPVPAQYRERFGRETAPLLAFLEQAQDSGAAQLAMSGR